MAAFVVDIVEAVVPWGTTTMDQKSPPMAVPAEFTNPRDHLNPVNVPGNTVLVCMGIDACVVKSSLLTTIIDLSIGLRAARTTLAPIRLRFAIVGYRKQPSGIFVTVEVRRV